MTDGEIATDNSRVTSRWQENHFNRKHWLASLAFITVGAEVNIPRLYRLIIPPLKDIYGFSDDELIFFHEHLKADVKHGAIGIKLVAQAAQTEEQKREALEAVNRGAQGFWLLHEICARDMQRHAISKV